jgi:signal transduction histidine kinase
MSLEVPYEKLRFFQEKIGLGNDDWQEIQPFHHLFVEQSHPFAQYFYDFFFAIPETRLLLQHQSNPDFLRVAWAGWFKALFTSPLDERLLAYIWGIGVRHVQVDLDQRFSNLGFSLARQFCRRMLRSHLPADRISSVMGAVDKLLDLSLLIETSAYVENTTRCDLEVMKEMADRVRNPLTIIGGNIKRLQGRVDAESKEYNLYQTLFAENQKIDGMVRDIKVYMDLFDRELDMETVDIGQIVRDVESEVRTEAEAKGVRIETELIGSVLGNGAALARMFSYLLRNSIEAVDQGGSIRVTGHDEDLSSRNFVVEIFNSGKPPEVQEMDRLFAPFYSTKPMGTGFGLPIAQLIARKHYGRLSMEAVDNSGTRVTVILPKGE